MAFRLLAIALMAALGPSFLHVVIALSVVYLPRVARVVRAATLVTVSTQYVEAARSMGASAPRVLSRHVLPNMLTPVIIPATFVFAYTILAKSSLSFLGVGVPEVGRRAAGHVRPGVQSVRCCSPSWGVEPATPHDRTTVATS